MTARSPLSDPVLGAVHSAVFSAESAAVTHRVAGKMMGTYAQITTVGGTPDLPDRLFQLLTTLETRWSRFLADSEISTMNVNPGVPIDISAETRELLLTMKRGHRLTRGAFDPTLLPALVSEGYSASLVNPLLVTRVHESARLRGNLREVEVGLSSVTVPRGTTLDSGGVGKGLAADIVATSARSAGALGVLVDVGGDLRVSGFSPRGDSWRLAIEDPRDSSRQLSVIDVSNSGVATSTTTKRRFQSGQRETHHIIDPRTLRSSQSDTVQATVIASSAADAEMWTKVAFVEGHKALFALAERHAVHAGCFLTSGDWVTTPQWPVAHA